MHDVLRNHILAVFKEYRPTSTESQAKEFLANKELRKSVIARWRQISIHKTLSEKFLFWELFRIRSLNFHTLTQDILAIEQLFDVVDPVISESIGIREYVISKDGDAILEFANGASEVHPVLRFRVSSHFLAASSPLFSRIFLPQQETDAAELDMVDDLPPPPTKHTCEDKMEVKVYRMPQFEANDREALTILLDAAHNHKHQVPKEIDFPTFVSIAEVCLRYRCLPVQIEFQVEYLWLPQWIQMAGDESSGRDGLLLITYVFGARGLFTRLTKSVILNAMDDAEIESKTLWPQPIRDKIKAIRAAKMAQISACCTSAISEYFRPPQKSADESRSVGLLALTTVPRCPRRSHLCDATNLGWLMLVYNEMRVLPAIMSNTGFNDLPESPRRSLKEQLDCLRLMPSAPEVHSGVCDYAPAFRSAINDIYNSISGLILEEVGSVLLPQKPADSKEDLGSDQSPPPTPPPETLSSHESICLRILSHLDDIDDLNSAALIDRGFYAVYKKNEVSLLKNVMRGERKHPSTTKPLSVRGHLRKYDKLREKPGPQDLAESKSLATDNIRTTQNNEVYHELYDTSPVLTPTTPDGIPMSHEAAIGYLYAGSNLASNMDRRGPRRKGADDPNEKYLLGEVSRIQDKTRMGEGDKQLREEKDKALGLGAYNPKPSS